MLSVQQHNSEFNQVKELVLEFTLLAILISSLPLLAISLKVSLDSSFNSNELLLFATILSMALLLIFRKHIAYRVKLYAVISLLVTCGSLTFAMNGLVSSGIVYFVLASIFSSFLPSVKSAYVVGACILLINGLVTLLFINGLLKLDMDVLNQATSPKLYLQKFSITIVYVLTIIYANTHIINFLEQSITDLHHKGENLYQALQSLSKSEDRYKSLLENTQDLIFLVDEKGHMLSGNRATYTYLNLTDAETIQLDISEAFPELGGSQLWREALDRLSQGLDRMEFHLQTQHPVYGHQHFSVSLIKLSDSPGSALQILATQHNITDLIDAQTQINQLNEQAKQVLEEEVRIRTQELELTVGELHKKEKMAALGNLVAGVAHEINTPLGVSISSVSFLESINQAALEKIAQSQLSRTEFLEYKSNVQESTVLIISSLKRVDELIQSFKRLAVDIETEARSHIHFCDFFRAIAYNFKTELEERQIELTIDCDESISCYTYPSALIQIVSHLITNSIEHAFENQDHPEIKIQIRRKDSHLLFTFTDNGNGIDEANASKIFDPFFTTDRQHQHVGLGLPVVYNLITAKLNGSIYHDGQHHPGTRFVIELPIDEAV